MRVFLAGIMQGSHVEADMHPQGYRGRLRELLAAHLPEAQVYDPLVDHQKSLDYDEDKGKSVFLHHNRMCGEVDLLIAFVPEASMGTAIEMWEAWRNGRIVFTISPLSHNWTVRFCSHVVFPDIASFEAEVCSLGGTAVAAGGDSGWGASGTIAGCTSSTHPRNRWPPGLRSAAIRRFVRGKSASGCLRTGRAILQI
jgi:hypothetical protein